MKILSILLVTYFAFETTKYEFLEGLSKEEIKKHYLGLHDDYLKDTLLSMFMTSTPENI